VLPPLAVIVAAPFDCPKQATFVCEVTDALSELATVIFVVTVVVPQEFVTW
jgi:hypothetical protein